MRVVLALRAEDGEFAAWHVGPFRRQIRDFVYEGRGDSSLDTLAPQDLVDAYAWVLEVNPRYDENAFDRFILGMLLERAGQSTRALAVYHSLVPETTDAYVFKPDLLEALARLAPSD